MRTIARWWWPTGACRIQGGGTTHPSRCRPRSSAPRSDASRGAAAACPRQGPHAWGLLRVRALPAWALRVLGSSPVWLTRRPAEARCLPVCRTRSESRGPTAAATWPDHWPDHRPPGHGAEKRAAGRPPRSQTPPSARASCAGRLALRHARDNTARSALSWRKFSFPCAALVRSSCRPHVHSRL